jgi:hypothetical protein
MELLSLKLKRSLNEIHNGRPDECGHKDIERPLINLHWRPQLLQLSLFQHGHSIPQHHCFFLVVRDIEHGGGEFLVEPSDFASHLDPKLCIQIGERLVKKKGPGPANHSSTQGHPLPFAAGELSRLALQDGLQLQRSSYLANPLGDNIAVCSSQAQAETEIVSHGFVWINRVALKDHRQVAFLRRQVRDVLIIQINSTCRRRFQAGDHS